MVIEIDLITACLKRERKAEYELYRLTYSYLMSICFRYVNSGEEAREMVNVGFLRMLNNLEKYKPDTQFKLWARRVMINVLIDEYRKEKKHRDVIEYIEDYTEVEDYSEFNHALIKMDADQIHRLINKLPPLDQKVFNLYAIDGYSHKEIAEMLDMSESTSKWHLHASRNKLKGMIQKVISPLHKVI